MAPTIASPLTLRSGATLSNRLAKAAMSEVLGHPETGAPTEGLVRLYERWGRSGAGMLITGNVMVDSGGMGEPGNVVILDERHLEPLRRWAEAGQAGGAQVWMQLNHAGRQTPRRLARRAVAPSAVPMTAGMRRLFAPPRALEHAEIEAIVERFAITAAVAKDAGFAGVQLHGAHGYLISQFLSPRTNLRDDAWGGDAIRRRHFLLETVRAVRAAVGAAFPIGVKLNAADFLHGGFTIEEAIDVARALDSAGIDVLEVSGGNYESPAMNGTARQSTIDREAYFIEYARRIREAGTTAILLTGGMRSRAVMDESIASGATDLVGLGRPMTHAPELPRELIDGTRSAAPAVVIKSRIRKIESALQVMWFQAQIHELARGREPDLKLGTWTALWRGIRAQLAPPRFREVALVRRPDSIPDEARAS